MFIFVKVRSTFNLANMKDPGTPPTAEDILGRYEQPLTFEKVWSMFQETDKKFRKLEDLFTSQWGRLIESLVEGDLVGLLTRHGIPVNTVSERTYGTYQGKHFEFDLVARNGEEVVIVEVKTTLRPDDVHHFIQKLEQAKTWMPGIRNNTLYGAMAYLKQHADAATMAMNKGLLVIRATGNSAGIINEPGFAARKF